MIYFFFSDLDVFYLYIFLIFFLIALAKTFSTSLYRSDESRQDFLVSDLRKKA